MMRIDTLGLFPEMIRDSVTHGVVGRAITRGKIKICNWNLRSFGVGPHLSVDDKPYGGGPGMVLACEPLARAIQTIKNIHSLQGLQPLVISTTPTAQIFSQATARSLSQHQSLIIICGRYEGIDQRIIDLYVDMELSIGSYVLSGGELPASIMIDCIARLIPGVLGNDESITHDSFCDGDIVEHHQYTRPKTFSGRSVPDILLSGHGAKIEQWQKNTSIIATNLRNEAMKKNTSIAATNLRNEAMKNTRAKQSSNQAEPTI